MRNVYSTHLIENYPDKQALLHGSCNHREVAEYQKFLYRAIKTQLTARQSEMLMRYYFNNQNMREIAEELQLNKATVSRCIRSAKNRLTQLARVYFEMKK